MFSFLFALNVAASVEKNYSTHPFRKSWRSVEGFPATPPCILAQPWKFSLDTKYLLLWVKLMWTEWSTEMINGAWQEWQLTKWPSPYVRKQCLCYAISITMSLNLNLKTTISVIAKILFYIAPIQTQLVFGQVKNVRQF